ncbi:MAG: hypothetical protein A3A33_01305 [Candidatus Yanofskybacteria bacterium RIFCSPLOWO2_01_FULL_49_25]|uniref:Addiction module toxin, HicA family n=1 Tax=Candidatus Yanofskybacteria bacterium RIFCSPLOWO2_01_FULL_49_25 TaxID=1802701 RepID=A0A1F8GX21_9BACT|nr:MAG: hypothetical protein A3A33_01305 [Candidatus Yanofskybacteria bacterium RIFCSPLOWO2_01_FULL_49_25]
MPRLTPIHWQKFEKFLLSIGCQYKRQHGSHRIYTKTGLLRPLVVPCYGNLPIFVIRNNLRLLNMAVDEYVELLRKV